MLKQHIRTTILELNRKGQAVRAIARALKISRNAVKEVLAAGRDEVPLLERDEKADPFRDQILDLYERCDGNRVRVYEELAKLGADFGYSTLTAWLKRQAIGETPKPPSGQYHFLPGEEMQHDTSPFHAEIGGVRKSVQIASLVICYSRLLFFQCYPRFRRFECKCFLVDAVSYVGGVCTRCMIDNTHVIVLRGTGKDMVPVPEMVAFSERLGDFAIAAHEVGDANRSARVEGHFNFIQRNFFCNRTFRDWADLNAQARAWCDKVNAAFSNKLHSSRRELFAVEQAHLRPLPGWIPDVYQLHQRVVDLEGYVHVDTNLYSAPWRLVGKALEVRETKDKVELYDGARCLAVHVRVVEPSHKRVTLLEHRPPRGQGADARKILPDEAELRRVFPEANRYLALLKEKAVTRYTRDVRRLLRFVHDYPRAPLEKAVAVALQYGLCDLDRLERLVLREVASDFFLISPASEEPDDR
jgi:hypothetical protein